MSDKKGTPFYKRFFDLEEFVKIIAPMMYPIPDSAYPNAMLLDGSRPMQGTLVSKDIQFEGQYITFVGASIPYYFIASLGSVEFWAYDNTLPVPNAFKVAALEGRVANPCWSIPRLGDVDLLEDKFIDLGNAISGLPAAAAEHRAKLGFVEGGAGARDRVYCCMKSDAGAYNWIEIANGGA